MEKQSKADIRAAMPLVTHWVKQQRQRMGDAHVTAVIQRAQKGEANCFFAMERGTVVGTPFTWTVKGEYEISRLLVGGASFIAAILAPDDKVDLQVGVPGLEVPRGAD